MAQLIANDCYKMGHFFYSLKAFDVLERLDPNPEYWEGKRGACVGAFQKIVAGKEPRDSLREITQMLRNTQNPQVEYIMRTFKVISSSCLAFRCRAPCSYCARTKGACIYLISSTWHNFPISLT